MIVDILLPFASVALAEIGDKTQLAVLLLATNTRHHGRLFLGVMSGFAAADAIAVALGSTAAKTIPHDIISAASGVIFLAFGLKMMFDKSGGIDGKISQRGPFLSGLILIGVSEMGDKTQIAAMLFATKYDALIVFASVLAALAVLSYATIHVGSKIAGSLPKKRLNEAAAILFLVLGLASFLG